MSFPQINQPQLTPNTIVPENKELYIPYFNQVYEDIASAVNSKDSNFFTAPISDTPTNIPNMPNFGSFIICVSGEESTVVPDSSPPTITSALCKSSATAAGSAPFTLNSQVGTGAWAGNALTITATATNFQIAHDRAGVTGNFNIKIIGTQ